MMILDGAMGTMIQRYELTEKDFGKGRVGCNDVLVLTRPDVIGEIHNAYLAAGADIIETNTFNANSISMEEYGLQDKVKEINIAGARLAREAADAAGGERRRLVAGSMGPTNVALSLGEVADARGVDYEKMRRAYSEQASALIEGGADLLLLETIFDTLNAKAAIAGIEDAFRDAHRRLPLMISVTLTEQGRTLSGQNLEAFVASVAHARPWSIGMNCGFGAEEMAPWLKQLREVTSRILPGVKISLHPNAGLPDELGEYTETPAEMATTMRRYMEDGLDIAGGCCGTTPQHIAALKATAEELEKSEESEKLEKLEELEELEKSEELEKLELSELSDFSNNSNNSNNPTNSNPDNPSSLWLAGNEALEVNLAKNGFLKVGERCNVAGSRKFLRLINENNQAEALEIAAAQIEKGAGVLDINMDDAMLDAPLEMERFVTLLGQDGRTARVPLMVDSSDMEVIRRALRRIQGKAIVNSISLKEGEERFLERAREIREAGAAVVVMAFDEKGQATDLQRRIEICKRAYRLLTVQSGFPAQDIIFDPNILTIATGMSEHDRYALDFLDAVEWIKKNLPGAKVSGGVSNLSFSFRGHNKLREAMHAIFLEHAIARGMDMAIVNPTTPISGEGIDPELRERIEDVIFARRGDAAERLMDKAMEIKEEAERRKMGKAPEKEVPLAAEGKEATGAAADMQATGEVAAGTARGRIEEMIKRGIGDGIESLLDLALAEEGSAMRVVNNRLMSAMRSVGDEFGAGRMFLPQVVRAAGVMKRAIDHLTPAIEAEAGTEGEDTAAGVPFVIATVKGDVHDIGKNIVGVILKCGGFNVIDLGVMVDEEKILGVLRESGAKLLGLSGLITPSLKEMTKVASMLEREGMQDVTLFVGGATTSDLHTSVKIAPLFGGVVIHTRDAAVLPAVAHRLIDETTRQESVAEIRRAQETLRMVHEEEVRQRNAQSAHKEGTAASVHHKSGQHEEAAVCDCCHGGAGRNVADKSALLIGEKSENEGIEMGIREWRVSIEEAIPEINWKAFLHTWRLSPKLASEVTISEWEAQKSGAMDRSEGTAGAEIVEAQRLIEDARRLLTLMQDAGGMLTARAGIVDARRAEGEDAILLGEERIRIWTPRKEGAPRLALADFVAPEDDHLGLFAVTAKEVIEAGKPLATEEFGEEYGGLLLHSLADRLVEAATEIVHRRVHTEMWGLPLPIGIRPAVGYAALPDQKMVFALDRLLNYGALGVELTENGALAPASTTTGLIFGNTAARYF